MWRVCFRPPRTGWACSSSPPPPPAGGFGAGGRAAFSSGRPLGRAVRVNGSLPPGSAWTGPASLHGEVCNNARRSLVASSPSAASPRMLFHLQGDDGLGTACGRYYRVGCPSITDSDIIHSVAGAEWARRRRARPGTVPNRALSPSPSIVAVVPHDRVVDEEACVHSVVVRHACASLRGPRSTRRRKRGEACVPAAESEQGLWIVGDAVLRQLHPLWIEAVSCDVARVAGRACMAPSRASRVATFCSLTTSPAFDATFRIGVLRCVPWRQARVSFV